MNFRLCYDSMGARNSKHYKYLSIEQADTSGVASPKLGGFGGPKCLILGEQQYFVWDTASQSTK